MSFIIVSDVNDLHPTTRLIPTGCSSLDKLIGNGLHEGNVFLIYGEAETGKTCLAIQCAVNAVRTGYKTIFIDSEATFSLTRLVQIAVSNLEKIASQIILVKPATFHEQAIAIDRLDEYLTPQIGLIVIDTITSLYRAEISERKEETFKLNRELGRQMACLVQIARTKRVAVLVTSQVYSAFLDTLTNEEPVGNRVLSFWADYVLHLKLTEKHDIFQVVLEKTPTRSSPTDCYVSMGESGICNLSRYPK